MSYHFNSKVYKLYAGVQCKPDMKLCKLCTGDLTIRVGFGICSVQVLMQCILCTDILHGKKSPIGLDTAK